MDYLEYFYPMIRTRIEGTAAERGGDLLGESMKEQLFQAALLRIRRCVSGYFLKLIADLLKEENPILQYDVGLITKQEMDEAAPILTQKLKCGEILLPERMILNVNIILDHFSGFLKELLEDLTDYRREICETLFEGKTYSRIDRMEMTGDTHNGGKATTIIHTDIGRFVYKPHSCRIDAAAYTFLEKYFSDIIIMPKAFAVKDRFGVVEFLEMKRAEGPAQAAEYYYSLGGTSAVLKMLGSRDMHRENLFACGTKMALIDIETLLYPRMNNNRFNGLDFYSKEDCTFLEDSLLFSSLLNGRMKVKQWEGEFSILLNTEEEGSAPVIDGVRRSVLEFRNEFFAGFSDYYDRILGRKEELISDIRELFSDCIFRHIVFATHSYSEILQRLNSRFSYSSEEYYRSQRSKLSQLLERERPGTDPVIGKYEEKALLDQEIPFFYTYGSSLDLYSGGETVCREYFSAGCVERALQILTGMNESEKQFEIQLIRVCLNLAVIKQEDLLRSGPFGKLPDEPLTRQAALEEAERILLAIHTQTIPLTNGGMTWLYLPMEKENPNIMGAGLYSGLAGMAVFFAGIQKLTGKEELRQISREYLDNSMRLLQRYLDNDRMQAWLMEHPKYYDVGEGAGAGGILRALCIVNRYSEGRYTPLLEAAVSLFGKMDYSLVDHTDKAGGIAGLLSTLCRYEEFYESESVQKLIETLAERLLQLKTLKTENGDLWKTLDDKNHPISGAVHGMCGIAEALFLAGKRLGTDRYMAAAKEALDFEDVSYSERTGGWEDLRVPGTHKLSNGNCYGPPGMGIIFSRLQKEGILNGSSTLSRNRMRARSCVLRFRDLGRDHLCCGNMSSVEYCIETGELPTAGKILAAVLEHEKDTGGYRLGYANSILSHEVTLFYGLAGVGYELLRYTDPEQILSIL